MDFLLFLAAFFTYKPVTDALPQDEVSSEEESSPTSTPKKMFSNGRDQHLQNGLALPGEIVTDENGLPNENYLNTSFSNDEIRFNK